MFIKNNVLEITDTFRKNVRKYIFENCLTQGEFAKMIESSQSNVSLWLGHAKTISSRKLGRVCRVLGMTQSQILGTEKKVHVNNLPENIARFTFSNGCECFLFKDAIKGFWEAEDEKGSYIFFGYKECVHINEPVDEVRRVLDV